MPDNIMESIETIRTDDSRRPIDAVAEGLDALERTLASCLGRPAVVHHFATWCEPCAAELPELSRILREHAPRDCMKIAVSWDLFLTPGPAQGALAACERFLAASSAPFDLLFLYTGEPEALFRSQRIDTGTVPFTELRDVQGTRVEAFDRPLLEAGDAIRFVAALRALSPQRERTTEDGSGRASTEAGA